MVSVWSVVQSFWRRNESLLTSRLHHVPVSFMDNPPTLSDDDIDAERAEWRARTLRHLVAIGMDMARMLQDQARDLQGSDPGVVGADLSLRFHRISRSIRMSLALDAKLAAGFQAQMKDRKAAVLTERKALAKEAVSRQVDRDTPDRDLHRERSDRIEREDLEDFSDKPVSEIIAIICADLGITPDWQAWSLEPWAIEERRTGVPGSPYNTHPTPIEHTPNIHSDDLREAPA